LPTPITLAIFACKLKRFVLWAGAVRNAASAIIVIFLALYHAMTDQDKFFQRANALLDRLEHILPVNGRALHFDESFACWRYDGGRVGPVPIRHASLVRLEDLQCITRQKDLLDRNTRQFLNGLPANHALLWGPRGTGKSSLIKAVFNRYRDQGLKLIEVDRDHLGDLPLLCDALYDQPGRFLLFCDDLSFASADPSYKALKVIMDGSISQPPDNVLLYATSNRRHLIPEYMQENVDSRMVEGELHLSEAIEEKLSLSERFGLWLSFHPFKQDQYLEIVHYWLGSMGATVNADEREALDKAALKWALEHGSRSGRSANLFARDWAGRTGLDTA
jgi:predicted AAA+ superfamily ATPase